MLWSRLQGLLLAGESWMPVRASSMSEHESAALAAKAAPSQFKVLLLEDNEDARTTLTEFLQIIGHEVCDAADANQGLAAARRFHPDAVLCDLGLPGKDGYAFVRELRADADPLLRGITVAALTGYGSGEDRARAADAGFDEFLVKPVDPDDLEKFLARLAAQRRP